MFEKCCFEVAGLGCFEFRSSVSATKRWSNQMSEPSSAFCAHSNAACVLASRKLLKNSIQSDRRGVVEKRKKARELGIMKKEQQSQVQHQVSDSGKNDNFWKYAAATFNYSRLFLGVCG